MRFSLQQTNDGSYTVHDQEYGETYKSRHAAFTESEWVFYRPGVLENPLYQKSSFHLLELGFGLGTNFSYLRNRIDKGSPHIHFTSIDQDLSGAKYFAEQTKNEELVSMLHTKKAEFHQLSLELVETSFEIFFSKNKRYFDAIYFDPFSPKHNPDGWTAHLFQQSYRFLNPGGRLVTYSVSKIAKEGAQNAGFRIEKRDLPFDLNKRNSLVAYKDT
ncbi:MAG: MnmC family methyltransferase [Oligoflexia bacterium]|nr:MnmC family methyltransferase [Oligoflexia bacterium]